MGASNYVDLDVDEILKETDSAILCKIGKEELWIPLSQVADPDDWREGDKDLTLSITEWFARKEGLGE